MSVMRPANSTWNAVEKDLLTSLPAGPPVIKIDSTQERGRTILNE